MRQKWVQKYPKNAIQSLEVVDTQVNELGNPTISTQFSMEINGTMIQNKSSNINSKQQVEIAISTFKLHENHRVMMEIQDLTKKGLVARPY